MCAVPEPLLPLAAPPLGSDSAEVVEDTIARAAFRGERALSVARAAFCLAILVRRAQFDDSAVARHHALVSVPALTIAIALSAWMIWRGWRQHRKRWLLSASTALDAIVCFTALLPNVLWPGPDYAGIVRMPDVAALLVITAASGLRLSPAAAGGAAVLNTVSLAILVAVDIRAGQPVSPAQAGRLSIWAIYLASAAGLALILARRTRRLVREGAAEAVVAENTRRRLGELLQDHHDLRTALTAATLNADLALRAAGGSNTGGAGAELPVTDQDRLRLSLDRLREDLRRADGLVTAVRSEAAEETRARRERVPVAPGSTVAAVFRQLQPRFPAVALSFSDRSDRAQVTAGGGESTLERILLNLVLNACEGDGLQSPRRVEVAVEPSDRPGWLRFSVTDDGPGFPASLLPMAGERAATTKKEGAGIGLVLIAGLLRANGTRLECLNPAHGGAVARFELPRSAVS
jgi:signal transduction histidine kinase